MSDAEDIKTTVRERYGQAALRVATGTRTSCCGGGSCGASTEDPITANLYSAAQAASLPETALLDMGNPVQNRSPILLLTRSV